MILVLESSISSDQRDHIRNVLYGKGYIVKEISDNGQNVVGAIGTGNQEDVDAFKQLPGVDKVSPISKPYKLVSRELRSEDTQVPVGDDPEFTQCHATTSYNRADPPVSNSAIQQFSHSAIQPFSHSAI